MPVVLFQATINGRGKEQQLYCPGTVDHSHKLTFKLDNNTPPSNSYVPLSYALIDQRTFFKMDGKNIDIDAIISSLNEVKTSVWPFAGEEFANVEWVAADQPETHIQVSVHYIRLIFDFHYDLLLMWIICLGVGTMWKWAMLQMLRINFCLDGSSLCLRACSAMYEHLKTGCALAQMFVIQGVPGQICHTLGEHSFG